MNAHYGSHCCLRLAFLIAEVVAGFLSGSLALISDAARMFTDAAALARVGSRF